MNYNLPFVPERSKQPRQDGITMVMDKSLSPNESENLIESSGEFVDLVKFGFGTSLITKELKKKISIYQEANINPYFGGTLFEAFITRGMFEEYIQYLKECNIKYVEVSDGSMYLEHEEKLKYIERLAKEFTVLSEVGSKQKGVYIPIESWVNHMQSELNAGAWKVIAESRESGTVGIYNNDGSANETLIKTISDQIDPANIIWEAPDGKQQIWFIKIYGANVNLGNIAPNGVIPLECLRRGLRGDTFFDFLPDDLKEGKTQYNQQFQQPYLDFQI
ncbi:MAG: phosphosulfolactate synthase [Bacteroidetes bacterium]|jgi:phosphosulfolactate synthase|nr:phosphosulfolactate synthase [Bacteroidota bacterium]